LAKAGFPSNHVVTLLSESSTENKSKALTTDNFFICHAKSWE